MIFELEKKFHIKKFGIGGYTIGNDIKSYVSGDNGSEVLCPLLVQKGLDRLLEFTFFQVVETQHTFFIHQAGGGDHFH